MEVTASSQAIDWPSKIPAVIKKRRLICIEEPPDSARSIFSSTGAICDGETLSIEVERTLFESFIGDDYEGKLHMTTLRDQSDNIVGFVFWREIPESEMKSWINWDSLSVSISDFRGGATGRGILKGGRSEDKLIESNSSGLTDQQQKHRTSLVPVREESLRWLNEATLSRDLTAKSSAPKHRPRLTRQEVMDELSHAWVKIELLAVRKQFWGNRYGSLLLACALYEAWKLHNNRVILHVAGGHSNVPAVRLYERFGFIEVKAGQLGGPFNKPDRDLFVLGNIGTALQSLSWSEPLVLLTADENSKGAASELKDHGSGSGIIIKK